MDHGLIQSTLKELLGKLQLPCDDVSVRDEDDMTRVDVVSSDPSRIIGWHGETLNAVQHVLKSIVRSRLKLDRTPFILLDVDGYRSAQEEKVRKIAEQKADFVRRTGSRVALSPMSPYFRRIVHLHVANTPALADLTTESIGEGDYRQIVLKLKKAEKGPASGEELSPVMPADDGLENLDV